MPTHMADDQYLRDDLDDYYRVQLAIVNLIRRQARKDLAGKSLFQDEIPSISAKALREFYNTYEVAVSTAARLGVDNNLSRKQQMVLANYLYKDSRRRDYYAKIIGQRLRHTQKQEPDPFTFVELEQRYQHHLWRKARRHQELGLGPTFENWCLTEDCPKPEEVFR